MAKYYYIAGLIMLFFEPRLAAQNYVKILPTDREPDIIRKAAHVVPSARQLRWQELELTAFFHFGINTFTDREWGTGKDDISLFNPRRLDVRQWIRVAKAAGIKQVILTAKHHDGFCLWPSKYTDHTIAHTPYKGGHGDIVREFADACHEYGMGMGIYLSPWDRNSPYYGDSAKYNELFMHWLTELLTNYGRVDEVWFDGANGEGPNGKKQVYAFEAWYHLIRKLQPQAVIAIMGPDVRWVGTESGQGRLTEWSVLPVGARQQESIAANSQKDQTFVPLGDLVGQDLGSRERLMTAKGLIWYPAETDVSIRPGWFYHASQDSLVRTPSGLMDLYFSSVGRNSVLLLNIPPDRDGLINDADIRSLRGWRKDMEATFGVNLATGAKVCGGRGARLGHAGQGGRGTGGKGDGSGGVGSGTEGQGDGSGEVGSGTEGKGDGSGEVGSGTEGKGGRSGEVGPRAMVDGDKDTYWTTTDNDTTAVINIALKGAKTFDILSLQEKIRVGQRIERFVFEAKVDGQWKQVAEGTTVGYKRLLQFDPITASEVRLRILSSRLNPTIAELGLYKLSE